MEPEGITSFTDIGVVSSQPAFMHLRVQGQWNHHYNSRGLEKEIVEGVASSEAQAPLRAKFQKSRFLPGPEEESFDLDEDPSKLFQETAGAAQKANLDQPRPLLNRCDSLIDFPYEEIDPRRERHHFSIAQCGRRDCPDRTDNPTFANRRLASIRLRGSSQRDCEPRRIKSMCSTFATIDRQEDEIWVETFSLNDKGKMEYFFKGLKGQECFKQPPTGAMNVVYLEDVVVGERDDRTVTDDIQREMKVPSVVKRSQKRSKWASFVQRCKASRMLASN